jgi:iron complex transport system permease protein
MGASTLLLALYSLNRGAADLSLSALLSAAPDSPLAIILWELRLPRTLLALVLGAGLGCAGAALQALFRNPLAEPGVLGISSSAALGAVLALHSGLSAVSLLALPIGGLCGAALVTALLLAVARRVGTAHITLLLAGVALNSGAGALVALLLNLAPNPYALYEISFWLMGSVTDRGLEHLALAAAPIALGILLLMGAARRLDALVLGEETARSLGIDPARLARRVVAGTALAVGPGVAVAGAIGFVGLLVPHAVRVMAGTARPAVVVPLSALVGAGGLLGVDLLVRLPFASTELKLGVMTGLLGAPLFFALALRLRGPGADR